MPVLATVALNRQGFVYRLASRDDHADRGYFR